MKKKNYLDKAVIPGVENLERCNLYHMPFPESQDVAPLLLVLFSL